MKAFGKIVATLVVVALAVLTVGTIAGAAGPSTSFDFVTDPDVGISGAPGSLYHVGGIATPADMVGLDCDVVLDVHNNDSRRSGTNIVISSNGVNVEADDVEANAGDAPPQNIGKLTLGEFVNAWVQFGPKGEASVDASIHLQCPDAPPPTTVPPDDTPRCMIPEGCDVAPPPATPPAATPVPVAPGFTG